jgi:hypothetical protein
MTKELGGAPPDGRRRHESGRPDRTSSGRRRRRVRDDYTALRLPNADWREGEARVTLAERPARSKVIVFTPADSVTCARTRRAKTQVSTAFGVIFLLISGLGVRFPRGAQMASEQGKRYELRILAVISGFRHGPVRAARQAADLREREASSRQRLAQRSYSV